MPTTLILGATRGLGASLVNHYAALGHTVIATTRAAHAPSSQGSSASETSFSSRPHHGHDAVHWVTDIDIGKPECGSILASACKKFAPIATAILTAGYFATESFEKPDWHAEVKMYTTSAIGPVFVVNALVADGVLLLDKEKEGKVGKVILVSSESGSIGLRHKKEGGGNYAHHASKAAENMVGKLLSLDLKDRGVAVGMIHPGFMRTEMTNGVGFDKYWDDGGAVTPDEAAKSLVDFVENKFGMDMTGQYWAPRGPRDIGTAEETIGKNLPTPLQLPW